MCKIKIYGRNIGPALNSVHIFFLQDLVLEQIVEQMNITMGFVSRPKVVKEGRTATCVLRPLSKKELLKKRQKDAKTSEKALSETPVGNKVTPEESAQQ